MNFERSLRLKNNAVIIVRYLLIRDVFPLFRMYLSLSEGSKLFFHPYIFQPKLGWLWLRDETILILSCIPLVRKIFVKIFPKAVVLPLVALNSKQEIVAFSFLRMRKRLFGRKYSAELGIVVRDDYQNKRLGTKLMTYLIDLARLEKVQEINLLVYTQNVKAIQLYRKFGFIIANTIEKTEIWNGNFCTFHEMILKL